jgi:hypothetical protein
MSRIVYLLLNAGDEECEVMSVPLHSVVRISFAS